MTDGPRQELVLGLVTLGVLGLGAGASYGAYSLNLISWSATSAYAVLALLATTALAALVALIQLVLPEKIKRITSILLVAFWTGATGGLAAPWFLGETPAWNRPFESSAYALSIDETPIAEEIINSTNNPLEGSRSTLNYVSPAQQGEFVMVSSSGTEIFDLFGVDGYDGSELRATASLWTESLSLEANVDLTSIAPEVRLVRGVFFDREASALYVSNLPIESDCLGLQLWSFDMSLEPFSISNPALVYTAQPCLESMTGAERFGGRIVRDNNGVLYLSVGDFGYGVSTVREEQQDGEYSERPEILSAPNSVGAIVAIKPDGAGEVISRGHRNPQGLYFDTKTNRLWESEHGPKGGDEVNLIQQGNDYGWPDVTYGGPYGGPPQPSQIWNLGRWYGANHEGFSEPVFSWLPSIAASQLLVYEGEAFGAWRGDLLVASFKEDIRRLRLDGTRVIYDEVISIGARPRDMVELSDGRLLITTDDSAFLVIQPRS